jgi:hypothetical protein
LFDRLDAAKIVALVNKRAEQWSETADAGCAFVQRFFNALARMDIAKSVKPDTDWTDGLFVYICLLILNTFCSSQSINCTIDYRL